MNPAIVWPDPGPKTGYTIRGYLGSGAWKDAYRASSSNSLTDVALLFYHEGLSTADVVEDLEVGFGKAKLHEFESYLPEILGMHKSPGGRFFIAAELLARPLNEITKVVDRISFARIARDLSRALTAIHECNLVHRDLKLDNCGLDSSMKAKIFDLGTVTSEDPLGNKSREGSILSRAPELYRSEDDQIQSFDKNFAYEKSADIWALGACLFALRTGTYPFVSEAEAKERDHWNRRLREGTISREQRDAGKFDVDKKIIKKRFEPEAEQNLVSRLEDEFRGDSFKAMEKMLTFDPLKRPTIREVEKIWSDLAMEENGQSSEIVQESAFDGIIRFVEAAIELEIEITPKTKARVLEDFETHRFKLSSEEEKRLLPAMSKFKLLTTA